MTTWEESEAASAAIHGGRHITAQLARFAHEDEQGLFIGQYTAEPLFWSNRIAPAGSGTVNERLADYALDSARVGRLSPGSHHYDDVAPQPRLAVAEAEAMVEWPIYRAGQAFKPQVVVNVLEGVAEATVTRGEADLILHDWDALNDGNSLDYERVDLDAMRAELARVADPEYRMRLLADMDKVIADWEEARA